MRTGLDPGSRLSRVGSAGLHRRAVRQGIPPREAASLLQAFQGGAGSPRGHQAHVHPARPGLSEAVSQLRATAAVYAGLGTDAGQPDGGRRIGSHHRGHRRSVPGIRQRLQLPSHRIGDEIRRVPHGVPRRAGRKFGQRQRQDPACAGRRRPAGLRGPDRQPALHRAAAALHRGHANQGDGGAGHRAAKHLRPDHRHPDGAVLRGAKAVASLPDHPWE